MGKTLTILVNPRAGAKFDLASLEKVFRAEGLKPQVESVEPRQLRRRLRALRGSGRLAVAGGDGTIQAAAAALRDSPTVLVPIPAGTLNHFARRLGIDSVERAAEAAARGPVRSVPLGRVEGTEQAVFLDTAVIGAYPNVVRLRQRMRGYMGVWPAAAVAGLWVWARWPRFQLTIRTDDEELHRDTTMVWVGTGPRTFPAPHEAPFPEAGEGLEVVILPSAHRRHALRLVKALRGRTKGLRPEAVGLEVLCATSLEIDAPHHIPITLDAEPRFMRPPIRLTLQDGAVRVVGAPPEDSAF